MPSVLYVGSQEIRSALILSAGEFRELVGITPAGYLRSRVNGPNHVRFDVRA